MALPPLVLALAEAHIFLGCDFIAIARTAACDIFASDPLLSPGLTTNCPHAASLTLVVTRCVFSFPLCSFLFVQSTGLHPPCRSPRCTLVVTRLRVPLSLFSFPFVQFFGLHPPCRLPRCTLAVTRAPPRLLHVPPR
jgi:hypothetical protein